MPATGTTAFDWQKPLAELAEKTEYLPATDDPSDQENEARRARHLCRYLASHRDALLILDKRAKSPAWSPPLCQRWLVEKSRDSALHFT